MAETIPTFASRLLHWWQASGRHDLPWQQDRTPYRVWVSEIMLQQTQVSTVIDYFNRFVVRFPNLATLAHAQTDEVLAHWSGLGYYARARNLHACAKRCMASHAGALPDDAATLETLPGIGWSTANAIVAQAHNERAVILDGNVKRALARHELIEGLTGQVSVQNVLWAAADRLTPKDTARDYTQAIMDLGATVCTRRKPQCSACPVHQDCQALLLGRVTELPTPRPKKAKKEMALHFFIYRNKQGEVLLQRRPNQGIWGGLWCLPHDSVNQQLILTHPGSAIEPIAHLLTHRRLLLTFEHWVVAETALDKSSHLNWLRPQDALKLGLPKPIETVIAQLCSTHS